MPFMQHSTVKVTCNSASYLLLVLKNCYRSTHHLRTTESHHLLLIDSYHLAMLACLQVHKYMYVTRDESDPKGRGRLIDSFFCCNFCQTQLSYTNQKNVLFSDNYKP